MERDGDGVGYQRAEGVLQLAVFVVEEVVLGRKSDLKTILGGHLVQRDE